MDPTAPEDPRRGAPAGRHATLYATLAGRDTVREVAELLAPDGIAVAPLKGALLQATGCADPERRWMWDVDLLVAPADFRRARARLETRGWREVGRSPAAVTMAREGRPLLIDLHHRLYAYSRYGPPTRDLLARARNDREAFSADVLIMDPLDLYAHLVGHFAKDRRDERQRHTLGDMARVAARHGLTPARVAAHLDAEGLGRAARYTLGIAREHGGDMFAEAVLVRLRPDPLAHLFTIVARGVVRAAPQPFKPAAIPAALLDRSLPAAFVSLAVHVGSAVSREARRLRRRFSPSMR